MDVFVEYIPFEAEERLRQYPDRLRYHRALLRALRVVDCMASIVAFINAASMASMAANTLSGKSSQGAQGIQSTVNVLQILVLCGGLCMFLLVTGAFHFTQKRDFYIFIRRHMFKEKSERV